MSELPHNRITEAELAAMPPKARKHPHVAKIYMEHDFLEAYAMHTDMRVAENPKGAIGNHLEWETHGEWQKDFLISQGLRPYHNLLEIGCGTGRLARKVVPDLEPGQYHGVDLSKSALEWCWTCANEEEWADSLPRFYHGSVDVAPEGPFDFIWAFSVFIHLPAHVMGGVFRECAKRMNVSGRFYFSYVPEKANARTGLKQFRHTLETYKNACTDAGLSFEEIPWPHQQHIALARRVDLGSS